MLWLALIPVGFILAACSREKNVNVIEKRSYGYSEIPGGTFQMGSKDGDADEEPVKDITMTGFQLGQMEVSVGQYRTFLAKSGTQLQAVVSGIRENQKGDHYPVVGLSFEEMHAFCKDQGGDLPTAAQLHYASRYDEQDSVIGGKDQRVIFNEFENRFPSTEPVDGGYENRFGVRNLLGNVWESSRDGYYNLFYPHMASRDPHSPLTDTGTHSQEYSGGAFNSSSYVARQAKRAYRMTSFRDFTVGFRCARPLPQDSKK